MCHLSILMKTIAILLFAAVPALAEEIRLFNGKDLTGWTFHSAGGAEAAKASWAAKDGVLTCTGEPTGFIRTAESYENFTLTYEWRWQPGDEGGNSGLLFHAGAVPEGKAWPVCIEAQLQSGNAGDFWGIDGTIEATGKNQGTRWQRIADPKEKPLGEWNTMTVTCEGDKVTVHVNGTLVNEGKNASVTKGAIGFQSEGTPIEFRNIVLIKK